MKVYVVNREWFYEGESTVAVFSTKELADYFVENYKHKLPKKDCFNVYEYELDTFDVEDINKV